MSLGGCSCNSFGCYGESCTTWHLLSRSHEDKGDDDSGKAKAGGDNDEGKGKAPEPAETEFSMNVVQFGLTDATSDTALKFQGSLSC